VNYITLTSEARTPLALIYHEYVHFMLVNTAGNVPAWFNEGLAEYYSTFLIEDDRKVSRRRIDSWPPADATSGKALTIARCCLR
jgi:hypothetical protein